MDYSLLEKSILFAGIPAKELRDVLETIPHHIQCYDKGETIFHFMEEANRLGVILEGRVQTQKPFPNGSRVNVSIRLPGDIIGPAAVFSSAHRYPCDVVSLTPATIMMFRKEDVLVLMQRNICIMENFIKEIATATYMLQQRLELLSYNGIAQKAACFLLTQARQSGNNQVSIPESVSNWAMIMNVSRSSLHRELKKLESAGILSYSPPVIIIHDRDALQNIVSL